MILPPILLIFKLYHISEHISSLKFFLINLNCNKLSIIKNKIPYKLTSNGNYPFLRRISTIMIMDRIALIIAVIGALNWGSIGLFSFDIVAWIFGGQEAIGSRIVYTVVALAGIWCISLIFRARERFHALDE